MIYNYLILCVASVFIFLLGITIGHSFFVLQLRKEENRKRELELAILDKRSHILKESKKISNNLEELFYKVQVQEEIDKITKNKDSS